MLESIIDWLSVIIALGAVALIADAIARDMKDDDDDEDD